MDPSLITGIVTLGTNLATGIVTWLLARRKYNTEVDSNEIENLKKSLGPEFDYKSTYYRDLILEISKHSNSLTLQFNELFGGDIFA